MHKVKDALHRKEKLVVDPSIQPTPVAVKGVEPVAVPVPGVQPTPVAVPNLPTDTAQPVYVPVDSLPDGTVLNRGPEYGGSIVVNHGRTDKTANVARTVEHHKDHKDHKDHKNLADAGLLTASPVPVAGLNDVVGKSHKGEHIK